MYIYIYIHNMFVMNDTYFGLTHVDITCFWAVWRPV